MVRRWSPYSLKQKICYSNTVENTDDFQRLSSFFEEVAASDGINSGTTGFLSQIDDTKRDWSKIRLTIEMCKQHHLTFEERAATHRPLINTFIQNWQAILKSNLQRAIAKKDETVEGVCNAFLQRIEAVLCIAKDETRYARLVTILTEDDVDGVADFNSHIEHIHATEEVIGKFLRENTFNNNKVAGTVWRQVETQLLAEVRTAYQSFHTFIADIKARRAMRNRQ